MKALPDAEDLALMTDIELQNVRARVAAAIAEITRQLERGKPPPGADPVDWQGRTKGALRHHERTMHLVRYALADRGRDGAFTAILIKVARAARDVYRLEMADEVTVEEETVAWEALRSALDRLDRRA